MCSTIARAVSGSFCVLTLLLAACTPAAAPATQVAAAPSVAPSLSAPTPAVKPALDKARSGGVVSRVMDRDVDHFDLQQGQTAPFSVSLFNVYQGLVRLDPIEHQKIMPEMAEKWEVSPDGKSYTFKFYKGIKWHDGNPLTMDDVKYSLERMQNPKAFKAISPRGEGMLAAMDKVEIASEDTVKITTKFPSASFLLNLATGWVAIEPKHIILAKGDLKRDCVGTGPFKLKEFNPNISLELAKNPTYYVSGLPYLDGIKFYTVKDASTRFTVFRTGKVQVTFSGSKGLTPTDAEIVKREMADKAVVYEHDSLMRYVIVFNLQKKPWDDVRIRKAVNLAFDRRAAIKVNGVGNIGSIFAAPWGMKPEEVAKLSGYREPKDQDVAEAKKLMAEAGFPMGLKTTLLCSLGGATERQGVVARDQLAKIGINAELVLLEQATVTERFSRRNFDLATYPFLETTGDPDETLYTYYSTGGGRNYGDFTNKEIDDLIEKQARTPDKPAREAILAEIEKKLIDVVPMVICFWDLYQTGAWSEVKNFRPGPGIHPWGKFDFMWLAK